MPIFEMSCSFCQTTDDCYLPSWKDANPNCPTCGGARERLVSRFASPLMGSIHKYTDPNKENSHMDGFWGYRKVSSISGHPEPVYLETMQQIRDFNKAEGLSAPGEVPTNATISADGKRILSDGLPGQWRGAMPAVPSRVWEMTQSLTSLSGKDPEPRASGPECTVSPVDASMMGSITTAEGAG